MSPRNINHNNRGNTQEKGSNGNAASPDKIGEPFHNPYTFIPFPEKVKRFFPTPLTADEFVNERHRKSGVLELEIKTLSPLMTCSPEPVCEQNGHKRFKALSTGKDVVLPATGVRGALRTLMTILSGGTLGYMDENLWLTQGRDAQLGPNRSMDGVPNNAFLAEIVTPGNSTRPGVIELGETKLIPASVLGGKIDHLDSKRPKAGGKPQTLTYKDKDGVEWKVKLSGLPIKPEGKKEGLFKGSGEHLELSEAFWKNYQGRHRHAVRPELKKGDLIWLEPVETDCTKITCQADIKSIQWARWGRRGVAFKNLVPKVVLPDSMRADGGVDMVTNLFGQIPEKGIDAAGPFAARVRPGNLIFFDALDKTITETLAPLAQPHPGCLAFYRDQEDLDAINEESPLKGYKVYRNTSERGEHAPWKYSVQGVYEEQGRLKPAEQKVNKTAELIPEGLTGKLKISFRALGADELALLYAACSVDWKLGGGKPLGLGHCRVTAIKMIDEDGNALNPMDASTPAQNLQLLDKDAKWVSHIKDRIALYRASQIPVERLRYPRAVDKNKNKSSRAGLAWFARHATPKKNGRGLETIWTTGNLSNLVNSTQIKAQPLPALKPDDPTADVLYGYDMVQLETVKPARGQLKIGKFEKFDPKVHASSNEKAGENLSQSRETRKAARSQRTKASDSSMPSITKDRIGSMITEELQTEKITPERAGQFLTKMEEFGISPDQSKKWRNKHSVLEKIIGKQ